MAVTTSELEIPHEDELFLGGQWTPPSTEVRVPVVAPATGRSVCTLPQATIDDAELAVARARFAFDEGPWPTMSLAERRAIVQRFTSALEERFPQIDQAQAIEAGMPITTAQAFSAWAAMVWSDAMRLSEDVELADVRELATGRVEVRREPIGPTLAILTYNGAHVVLALAVIPALLMGNPVICKLPPETRLLGYFMADAAASAGFPDGVFSMFAADAEVSKRLTTDPRIDAIHFTGGTEIGAEVAGAAAKRIARVTLELGGKSAAIVADDADLDEAVALILGGILPFQGQLCTALSRILVSRERHDALVAKLVDAMQAVKIGDPQDPETEFGPLSQRVLERSEGFIARALEQGASIATGGKRPTDRTEGWYLEPTLLIGVTNDMEVAQNEVFGPVYCVIACDDVDDAVSIANDSKYGLAGSVFTKSPELGLSVARRVRSGFFAVNGNAPCLIAPYGGMKQSGYGRVGGLEGLLDLTNIKTIQLPTAS